MDIVDVVNVELETLKLIKKDQNTGEVRKIARVIYKEIKDLSINDYLDECEKVLNLRSWASWIIAFELAFRKRKDYTVDTFPIFQRWLFEYVRDWEDCDDFSVHALGALVMDFPQVIDQVYEWCDKPEFWVRRAAAVCLIYSIRKDAMDLKHIFGIASKLMGDEHYLVQKGYGWMLREYSKNHQEEVVEFVKMNAKSMQRTAFRYAIRDVDKEVKRN